MSTLNTRRAQPGGFTLLELVVVMTLAGLVLGLATLLFANTLPSVRLSATGREIFAAIRHMNNVAQHKGEDQVLVINLDTRQYGAEGAAMKNMPSLLSVRIEDPFSGDITKGKYRIFFHAEGGVEGGTVIISYKKRTIRIGTDPIVGAVML